LRSLGETFAEAGHSVVGGKQDVLGHQMDGWGERRVATDSDCHLASRYVL